MPAVRRVIPRASATGRAVAAVVPASPSGWCAGTAAASRRSARPAWARRLSSGFRSRARLLPWPSPISASSHPDWSRDSEVLRSERWTLAAFRVPGGAAASALQRSTVEVNMDRLPDIRRSNPSTEQNDRLIDRYIKQTWVPGSPLSILEAGCGQAWWLQLDPVPYVLCGVDIDRKALEIRKCQKGDLHETIEGDLRTV